MMRSNAIQSIAAALLIAAVGCGTALAGVPDALRPTAGERAKVTVFARGSQIYRCEANPSDSPRGRWVFQAPEADLFRDVDMTQLMGRHYDGPTWEGLDQSKVEGKVKANVPASQANAIPLLLLDGTSNGRPGVFADISAIQRLDTAGGRLVDPVCQQAQLGATLRLPYTATYVFFGR